MIIANRRAPLPSRSETTSRQYLPLHAINRFRHWLPPLWRSLIFCSYSFAARRHSLWSYSCSLPSPRRLLDRTIRNQPNQLNENNLNRFAITLNHHHYFHHYPFANRNAICISLPLPPAPGPLANHLSILNQLKHNPCSLKSISPF